MIFNKTMKKWWFLIGACLVLGVYLIWWMLTPTSVQTSFLNNCKQGLNDLRTTLAALQEKNDALCEKVKDSDVRIMCHAEVLHDTNVCEQLPLPQSIDYCKTLVKKEKELCEKEDTACLAYTTGEVSYCDQLDTANAHECKAIVLLDASFLQEEDCVLVSEKLR